MYSVTARCKMIKQPRGGLIRKDFFDIDRRDDGFILHEEESLPGGLVGATVDYLSRLVCGTTPKKAFDISLKGAACIGKLPLAFQLLGEVKGLDEASIICACRLAGFDVCLRRSLEAYIPVETIDPDPNTIDNICHMVSRCISFWDDYGPVKKHGFNFPVGYTPVITSGDGDYLTEDTVWDLKVLRREPSSQDFLQIYVYYLMGRHSLELGFFDVHRFGIFNPQSNMVYVCPADRIPKAIRDYVCHEIIGYEWTDEEYANIPKRDLYSPENVDKLQLKMEALKPYLVFEKEGSQSILEEIITSILKRVPNEAVQIILYNPSDKNELNDAREIGIAILLSSQIDNKKESSLCNLTTNFERKHKKTLSIVDIQLANYKKRPDAPFYKEVANGAVIWSK